MYTYVRMGALLLTLIGVTSGELPYTVHDCQRPSWTFQPRPQLDNLVSLADILKEISDVTDKRDCFSECIRAFCNLVLHNPVSEQCRLYNDAFHSSGEATPEPGWVYYGVPCDQYRLKNMDSGSHVLTSDPLTMCADNNYVTYDICNNGSCFDGVDWMEIDFKCVFNDTYYGPVYPFMVGTKIIELPFDLRPGKKVTFDVYGSFNFNNKIYLQVDLGDEQNIEFFVSIDFWAPESIGNSREDGTDLTPVQVPEVPSNNRYLLEIYITDTDYQVYTDGSVLLTAPIRFPMNGTSSIRMSGFDSLYALNISSFEIC